MLDVAIDGTADPEPLRGALGPGRQTLSLMHAKRDGQACFAYLDGLTGLPEGGETRGRPGDVFVFGGDPSGPRRERSGQIVLVYGPDHLFVSPFDRGGRPRRYRRVGSFEDVASLARLGEHVWRHGAREIDLELVRA
ncbi:MAG: hypothetical protein WD993_04290 [Thermoleophilaceae bacterium]